MNCDGLSSGLLVEILPQGSSRGAVAPTPFESVEAGARSKAAIATLLSIKSTKSLLDPVPVQPGKHRRVAFRPPDLLCPSFPCRCRGWGDQFM